MSFVSMILPLSMVLLGAGNAPGETAVPKEKGTYAVISTSKGTLVIRLFQDKTPLTVNNFAGLAEGRREWTDPATGRKVKKPFYNNLVFHRVIRDFMIQGGCPLGNGTGGPGYQFEDECYERGEEVRGKIGDEATAYLVWTKLIVPHLRQHRGESPSSVISALSRDVASQNSGKPLLGQTVEKLKKETGSKTPLYRQGKLIHEVAYGALCMANAGPDSNGSQFFIVTKKDGCSWLNGKHTVFGTVVSGMEAAHAIEGVKKNAQDRPLEDVKIQSVEIRRVK